MANQPNSKKRAEKLRQEQEALNNVFRLFLIGIVAETYLLILYNKFVKGTPQDLIASSYVIRAMGVIGGIALVLGLILTLVFRKAKVRRVFHIVAAAGAFFGVSSAIMYAVYPGGTIFMTVLVPILTVLGLVYFLFQPEFFLTSVILTGSIFSLWVCSKGIGTINWNTKVTVGAVLVLLGLVAVAALTRMVEKNGGKWIGKGGARLFTQACPYKMLYLTYAACFVTILLALVMVSTTYYTIWILGILFFALAVYYTSRLM